MSILDRFTGRRAAVELATPRPSATTVEKPATEAALGEYGGPTTGSAVAQWQRQYGSLVNLTKLNPALIRRMREHPQITAALAVQSLPIVRADWSIECDDPDIRELVTTLYERVHDRLARSMTRALWAGYSPNVLVWDVDGATGALTVTGVRDLDPATCAPRTNDHGDYAGFRQTPPSGGRVIDVDPLASLWGVEGLESGNLFGRSLLTAARQPWQDQMTVGLYHLRYLERFGEPVVVARAPSGMVNTNEAEVTAAIAWNEANPGDPRPVPEAVWTSQLSVARDIAENLRHHSVVALPSGGMFDTEGKTVGHAWALDYLSAGTADGTAFADKIAALDRAMARGMLVPSLLIEGGDAVGSNALGQSHRSVWVDGVEARLADYAAQITQHVLSRLVEFNFGPDAPRARLAFAPMADEDAANLWNIAAPLVADGRIPIDGEAVAARLGLPLLDAEDRVVVETPEETLARVAPEFAAELAELDRPAPRGVEPSRRDDAVVLVSAPADASDLPEWKRPAAVDPRPWRRELTPREQRVGFRAVENGMNTAEARAIDELVTLLEASHERVARQVSGIMRRGGSVAEVVTALGTVNLGPVAPWVASWAQLQRDVWGIGLESVRRELATFADAVPGDIGRDGLALVKTYAQASADRTMADLSTRVRLELLASFRSGVSPAGMLATVSTVYDKVIRGEGQAPRLTTRMLASKAVNEGRADAIARGGIPLAGAQFSAILDTHTCELCERLDEQLVSVADLDFVKFTPPLHHNCRCVWVYVTTGEADFAPDWSGAPKGMVDSFGGLVFG